MEKEGKERVEASLKEREMNTGNVVSILLLSRVIE